MKLLPIPALSDNYIWMLHDGHGALVVDPGEAAPVLRALAQERVQLDAILVTHHHADHTAGIRELQEMSGAKVYGPAHERIADVQHPLEGGARVDVLGLSFGVIDVPGHTAGHIAYHCAGESILFCGDTLFSAGCGRLFEGTPAQMLASLNTLAALPGQTRVCCTHEYTLSNLRFAREVDPDNQALQRYQAQCSALREAGTPTLPSTMALELQINPFLRSEEPALAQAARRFDAAAAQAQGTFAVLRQWKNQFK